VRSVSLEEILSLHLLSLQSPESESASTNSDQHPTTDNTRNIISLFYHMACEQSGTISKTAFREALLRPTSIATNRDADVIFDIVDTDGSGTIELHELTEHLSKVGYHAEEIQTLFQRIRDDDSNDGSVSRAAFRRALLDDHADFYPTARVGGQQQLAPKWYFMNSVKHSLQPLGPIGRLSQRVERRIYNAVSKLFAIDTNEISKLGVPFALSYSILSHVNGALTFSVAWYLSCKRVSLLILILVLCTLEINDPLYTLNYDEGRIVAVLRCTPYLPICSFGVILPRN